MARPAVVIWFKIYCAVMVLIYAFSALVLVLMGFLGDGGLVFYLLLGALCAGLGIVSGLPILLPARPWVWVYGLVMIGLGMTSACLLPVCIPLLIFWIRPEVRRHYGKVVV